jgi:hypothetical protein
MSDLIGSEAGPFRYGDQENSWPSSLIALSRLAVAKKKNGTSVRVAIDEGRGVLATPRPLENQGTILTTSPVLAQDEHVLT